MTYILTLIKDIIIVVLGALVIPFWLLYQFGIWLFGYEDILARLLFQCGKDDDSDVDQDDVMIPGVDR